MRERGEVRKDRDVHVGREGGREGGRVSEGVCGEREGRSE